MGALVSGNNAVFSYEKEDDELVSVDGIFKFGYDFNADFYWGTGFEGGLYSDTDAPSGYSDSFNFEKYYINIAAKSYISFTVELFEWYRVTPTVYLRPFNVHALEAWVLWFRPESTNWDTDLFDINFYLSSNLAFLKAWLGVQEQVKICGKSVADWIDDSEANSLWPDSYDDDCYFLDGTAEEYDDEYWHISAVDDYFPDYANSGYYGEIPLFNYWILDKWDW